MAGVAAALDPVGELGVEVVVFPDGFGTGDGFIGVELFVAGGGLEGEVDAFVGEVEAKGAVGVAVDELAGAGGEDVGDVAGFGFVGAVVVDGWVFVLALAEEAVPVVEAGAPFVAVAAHVPLAVEAGAVAGFLEDLGEGGEGFVEGAEVVLDLVGVHVEAGEDGGAAGGAETASDEGVLEVGAAGGEAVEMRRLEPGVAGAAHGVVTVIVTEDEDDVAALRGLGGEGGGGG